MINGRETHTVGTGNNSLFCVRLIVEISEKILDRGRANEDSEIIGYSDMCSTI